MYAVVEFKIEGTVALVAESWLTDEDNIVKWPAKFKTQGRIDRAVQRCEPPSNDYERFPCRVLYKTASYEKGMAKVRQAQDTSDIGTDMETEVPPKRIMRPNPRYQQDASSDEEIVTAIQPRRSVNSTSNNSPSELPCPPPSLILSGSPSGSSGSSGGLSRSSSACTATEKKLLTLIEKATMITTENRTLLKKILRKLNTSQQELDNGGLPEGLTFPLKLLRDVRDLEALLQNFEKEKLLVTYLSNIGGENLGSTVRRILVCILTNDLAKQFNWIGKGTKEAFCKLRLVNVVHRAVRRNPAVRSATNAEIDSIIKDWFRYAKDRDGGRARRARQASVSPSENVSQESTEDYGSSDEHDRP
ncbi:uncharacterized protein LOC117306436 [Asterias rubens]|uniref:uncharacterized protein LOC117306436 n=1 Tax=Asterias rubens TaxID=7604 RepID=UPI0014556598|nr:uncharacterized protein LOC117306436 [Asterias rubens]